MMGEYAQVVWRSLLKRQLRSWLTIIGIVIGVASIISLITLGEGLKTGIEEQFERLGVSNIRVIPGDLNGPPAPGRTLPNEVMGRLEAIKGVDYVDPVTINRAVVGFDNAERFTQVIGSDTSTGTRGFVDLEVDVQAGRFLTASDRNSVVIGHAVAHEHFFTEKDVRVRNSLTIEDVKFSVVGILEETGGEFDSQILIPLSTARELFSQPDTVNGVVVHLEPGLSIDEAAVTIERQLKRDMDEEEFDLFTPRQILDTINQVLGVVQLIVAGIAAIALLVGAIGITNVMFTAVLERTREIGVMKAVGARNVDILVLFIMESGLIGLVGGVLGIALGSFMAYGMGALVTATGFTTVSITLNPQLVGGALLFAFVVGVSAGTLPALQAAKLKPVQALRYE